MAGPWEKYRQQPQGGIPMAPAANTRLNNDTANTESQIGSRNVQNVNTEANTGKTLVDTEQAKFDLDGAIRARAKGQVVNDQFTDMLRNQLLAVRDAKPFVHRRSTGSIGELIGQPGRAEGQGFDLSDLPLLGGMVYGGSDRARLQSNLATVTSGAKFNMIDALKERAQATGSAGTGLGATAIPEFMALGQANFNLENLAGGPAEVTRQLGKAEDVLLRRYAVMSLPQETIMAMSKMPKEQRQQIIDASFQAAKKEYAAGFKPPQAAAAPQMDTKAAALAELRRRGVIK
jgi:hypothetical protein